MQRDSSNPVTVVQQGKLAAVGAATLLVVSKFKVNVCGRRRPSERAVIAPNHS